MSGWKPPMPYCHLCGAFHSGVPTWPGKSRKNNSLLFAIAHLLCPLNTLVYCACPCKQGPSSHDWGTAKSINPSNGVLWSHRHSDWFPEMRRITVEVWSIRRFLRCRSVFDALHQAMPEGMHVPPALDYPFDIGAIRLHDPDSDRSTSSGFGFPPLQHSMDTVTTFHLWFSIVEAAERPRLLIADELHMCHLSSWTKTSKVKFK